MKQSGAHPDRLLLALDSALTHEISLIIYGRAALWLGFDNPPVVAAATKDIDAIIPLTQVRELSEDMAFWDARDAVNKQLETEGLYITHLFSETEVFLSRNHAVGLVPPFVC